MTLNAPAQHAATQLALLRTELGDSLRAKSHVLSVLANRSAGAERNRLFAKASGVTMVIAHHLAPLASLSTPVAVREYIAQVRSETALGGVSEGFAQGVEVALQHAESYLR